MEFIGNMWKSNKIRLKNFSQLKCIQIKSPLIFVLSKYVEITWTLIGKGFYVKSVTFIFNLLFFNLNIIVAESYGITMKCKFSLHMYVVIVLDNSMLQRYSLSLCYVLQTLQCLVRLFVG